MLEALESGRAYTSLSLSSGGGTEDGEELDPLESLGEIEHEYEVSEDRAVLAPGFKVLDERERAILHLRFFEGLTQSQIAQQVGISQMHVSRLIRRALEKIRDEIAADEFDPEARRLIETIDRSRWLGWPVRVASGRATCRSRRRGARRPRVGRCGAGAPLLFWHALGPDASAEYFAPVAERLAAAGHRVVAVDGPGFGASPLLDEEGYALDSLADLVQRLVVRLELAPLVVMGHSWGGAIAVRYAAAHPENVSGARAARQRPHRLRRPAGRRRRSLRRRMGRGRARA